MTNDIRNLSDLSKCAYSSHFDIYENPHELKVMPGYESADDLDGDPHGLRAYRPRCFVYDVNATLIVGGSKTDGTGSSLHNLLPGYAYWQQGKYATSLVYQGTDTVMNAPYAQLVCSDSQATYLSTYVSNNGYWTEYKYDTVTDKFVALQGVQSTTMPPVRGAEGYSGRVWFSESGTNIVGYEASEIITRGVLTGTNTRVVSGAESSKGLWLLCYVYQPYSVELRLWDRANTLYDQVISFPSARGGSVGVVNGTPVCAINEFLDGYLTMGTNATDQANGDPALSVWSIPGTQPKQLWRHAPGTTTGAYFLAMTGAYKNAYMFWARIPKDETATEFMEGVWAVGQSDPERPHALSLLYDTSSMGLMNGSPYVFGRNIYFAHDTDWKVSRVQDYDDGDYDITAEYHTLMYGATTPFEKELNGITVTTTELPANGVLTVSYRTTIDGSWVQMGTSTSGNTHTFTRIPSGMVGKFQEIQFKIELVGKASITDIVASINELDSLPYNL